MLSEDAAAIVCIIVFFAAFFFEIKLNRRLDILGVSRKPMKEAIRRNHVITAYYVPGTGREQTVDKRDGNSYRRYYATYQYTVNGKNYRKKGVESISEPSQAITLYYVDDPGKAFVRGENTGSRVRRITPVTAFIIPFIIAGLLYNFLI